MKKVLMVATYGDFFAAFEVNNIKTLIDMGFEVHLCANWTDTKYNFKHEKLNGLEYKKINIEFERSPFAPINIKNFFELSRVMKKENYYLVDCHNSVVGLYARIAAKKNKVAKVMYTAHGFQFHKRGRTVDWVLYFPLEYLLSSLTDSLVVINKEDYRIAKKMLANHVHMIPGVGIDTQDKNEFNDSKMKQKKIELNLPENSFVILSVGELSKRKNHKIIIKALAELNYNDIYYLIAGQGEMHNYLISYAKELGLNDKVKLLGHRNDINELNEVSDIAAFPSKREGLGIAGLEALKAGLPLISSNVQGIPDYSINDVTGLVSKPDDYKSFSMNIEKLYLNPKLRNEMKINAKQIVQEFDIVIVEEKMEKIYSSLLGVE